jgi:hypothetical protein
MLHQQSASNSKPEYIMGHSFQAISLLVQGPSGHVAAVPLTSRIHEGLVFSNRDSRSLLDKLAVLLLSITSVLGRKITLVADAYYASGKLIAQLLSNGHQLVTRAKSNAVAYLPLPTPEQRRRADQGCTVKRSVSSNLLRTMPHSLQPPVLSMGKAT